MGYTHYWTQRRDFTIREWKQVREDMESLLKDVQHVQGIPLGDGMGEKGSSPVINNNEILFNGIGEDSHETFCLYRKRPPKPAWQSKRGWDFCKTARKPYDLAVTAALCYLATVAETHDVNSDGDGAEWLDGLAEARRALPRYANILDIPRPILESDRWCMPWIHVKEGSGYEVYFCVDGHGYVEDIKRKDWYRFTSHRELAEFLDRTKAYRYTKPIKVIFNERVVERIAQEPNIWDATGAFDGARNRGLAWAQRIALAPLFDDPDPARHEPPPAYVRPGEMPPPAVRAYSFMELLRELDAA